MNREYCHACGADLLEDQGYICVTCEGHYCDGCVNQHERRCFIKAEPEPEKGPQGDLFT